jgi:hypothetical protein
MKDVFLRQLNANVHPQPIVPLEHAGGTVATGADLATGIAADAAVELMEPKGQPIGRRHLLNTGQVGILILVRSREALRRFAQQNIEDHRNPVNTARTAGQSLARLILKSFTGHADDKNPLTLDLLFGQEDIDGTTVARLDDDGNVGRLLVPSQGLLLIVKIGD